MSLKHPLLSGIDTGWARSYILQAGQMVPRKALRPWGNQLCRSSEQRSSWDWGWGGGGAWLTVHGDEGGEQG